MWDAIFADDLPLPVWQTPTQSAPLDLGTIEFYDARKVFT